MEFRSTSSRNSVLFQSNINNTRSDVAHLIRVLAEISGEVNRALNQGGANARKVFNARVKSLMTDVPDLPNFSRFHDGFRGDAGEKTNEGESGAAFTRPIMPVVANTSAFRTRRLTGA